MPTRPPYHLQMSIAVDTKTFATSSSLTCKEIRLVCSRAKKRCFEELCFIQKLPLNPILIVSNLDLIIQDGKQDSGCVVAPASLSAHAAGSSRSVNGRDLGDVVDDGHCTAWSDVIELFRNYVVVVASGRLERAYWTDPADDKARQRTRWLEGEHFKDLRGETLDGRPLYGA